mmetsp:Transcript_3679/g.5023  ORF Transcript_3679/g.5023 Transcript_3679/m.5023 type:complete len:85 (+) Transcript_3679:750-1004(+)
MQMHHVIKQLIDDSRTLLHQCYYKNVRCVSGVFSHPDSFSINSAGLVPCIFTTHVQTNSWRFLHTNKCDMQVYRLQSMNEFQWH